MEQPTWQQLCEDAQTSTRLFQDLIKNKIPKGKEGNGAGATWGLCYETGFRLIHVTFPSIAKLVHFLQGYITTLTYTINLICSGTGYEINKSDMSCVCWSCFIVQGLSLSEVQVSNCAKKWGWKWHPGGTKGIQFHADLTWIMHFFFFSQSFSVEGFLTNKLTSLL